ncbi:MAG: hypothetical protein GF364_05895 [Candidatus Lokiarchaeota archaeon]|nr:hypothetical protein [Candidatus Lokiarchaeota archaeon]
MDRTAPDRDFHVVVGDSINDGSKEADWQYFFEKTNSWLHNIPMMNCTGNHDTNSRLKYGRFAKTWDHPYVDMKNGGYYSFRYANALFIMADSDNGGRLGTVFSDKQFEWVEDELEKGFNNNLWIFVCFHRQMYSTGDFSMEPILHQFYRPLFDQYHVDCVMYGHDHNYQAFWTDRESDWGGTKYFVCGAAGGQEKMEVKIMGPNKGKTIYVWPSRTYIYKRDGIPPIVEGASISQTSHRLDEVCKDQLYAILEPNFVDFKIKGNQCHVRAMGWQDQVFHQFNFTKNPKNS